ncbi:hypothetical protein Cni_G06067 [Canna indica]|uniref:Uncharacterized protein n=1 Tax=Canna indica TaxID=4628 RepID=A0AAQ3Q663_9LILI|nr:hypothetical protein Cni_G06067 [Canna indica]
MATPAIPLDDDDDDFDWDAAVREIDNACQLASASTSTYNPQAFATPVTTAAPANLLPGGGKGRQSTLDPYVVDFRSLKRAKNDGENEYRFCDKQEQNLIGGDEEPAVKIDMEAAKTWIYPVNVPLRDYQFAIARTALFSNTLVALPTGLGKTLIAAVVMYNYFRWFPEGKIVFTAPSRPLVMQQIEACHNIVGISQEWTIDMTGQMSPPKRSTFWKTKRVFFVTPQVFEKDIQSGICLVKQLVCLVIDEAHRALGNYSYCVAVRELMAVPVQLRILALTATPGSKQQAIQTIINNLHVSTMEYRSESDHDVSPYVHNRKLELIQVPMSEDASAINNLLLEVIRPYVTRLCAIGVLHNRDAATWTPCELLNLRDKFRQAPPSSLPHTKYGEVEGSFGVLITLYHIRKLLSSHGIRPAYDMLEEKLKQGSFARMMSRNERILKANLLMDRSLLHGAPNPKLVKMTEILLDHFKRKDPKESRVIIFSNFRGSVKDIMNSLSCIGDLVKATEFIGQSSGKSLKGQSQKVQQAVLQKFRNGGYNVIVATSIGEEGLDIMEVDLVICFDANVSPLRMIQRMGRTGRKHDGRVVVLASEGSELKGYLKKQATSKAIRKHMHNGGINSFNFHVSPRMVPHICKPEVQFVELSIEQFMPRGKKMKEDAPHHSPFLNNISKDENDLIARYFGTSKKDIWAPSLIAFPSFQTFPSRVHSVRHSFKSTMMLIDTMQCLEGLTFSKAKKDLAIKEATSSPSFADLNTPQINAKQDSTRDCNDAHNDTSEDLSQERTSHIEAPSCGTPRSKDIVTINAFGCVSVPNVPTFPLEGSVISKIIKGSTKGFPGDEKAEVTSKITSLIHDASPLEDAFEPLDMTMCTSNPINPEPCSPNYVEQEKDERMEFGFQTPAPIKNAKLSQDTVAETPCDNYTASSFVNHKELSPRLTYFIEKGIVPESPLASFKVDNVVLACLTSEDEPGTMLQKEVLTDGKVPSTMLLDNVLSRKSLAISPNCPNVTKLLGKMESVNAEGNEIESERKPLNSPFIVEQSPLANPVTNSSIDDWQMSSGAKSVTQVPKYRRLCKYGDKVKRLISQNLTDKYGYCASKSSGPNTWNKSKEINYCQRRKKKTRECLDNFIELEAEVSEDAQVSEDEEDDGLDDKYEDSFIDDGTNPTESNTQAKNVGGDMLAFYRRSLLTQSPMETLPKHLVDSVSSKGTESGSYSSEKLHISLQTPQNGLESSNLFTDRYSVACQVDTKQGNVTTICGEGNNTQRETSSRLESRKRKLSFHNACSIPANLEPMNSLHSEELAEDLSNCGPGSMPLDNNLLCDDDFYQSIDLDALEAQATEVLRYKSTLPVNETPAPIPSVAARINEDLHMDHPSFDLGL